MRVGGDGKAEGVFDGEAVREGVSDGGVAADAFRQWYRVGDVLAMEEPFDSLVDVPESGLHLQDGLADDGEAEVSGFDEAGVDGADGDLVDAGAVDGGEWVLCCGVVAHGVPAGGRVRVVHEASRHGVVVGLDPVEVAYLAFEAA